MEKHPKVVVKKATGVGAAAAVNAAGKIKVGGKVEEAVSRKYFVSGPGLKARQVMAKDFADAAKQGAELAKCKVEEVKVTATAPAGGKASGKKPVVFKKPEAKKITVADSTPVELTEEQKQRARSVAADLAKAGENTKAKTVKAKLPRRVHALVTLPDGEATLKHLVEARGFKVVEKLADWPYIAVLDKDTETKVVGIMPAKLATKEMMGDGWIDESQCKDLPAAKAMLDKVEAAFAYDQKANTEKLVYLETK